MGIAEVVAGTSFISGRSQSAGMVQCEMCGTETASPNRVKIEGAELDVCDECTDFGTEVKQDTGASTTSTKYSTDSSGSSSGSATSGSGAGSSGSGGGGSSRRRQDMFDEMDEVVQDYDDRIRQAREAAGLSQEELAKKLNEKASLIRKLERGGVLPSDDVQTLLERELGIDLSAGSGGEDSDWDTSSATDGLTLGDMVEHDS